MLSPIVDVENDKYKECYAFNVALDFVRMFDGSSQWHVCLEYRDGSGETFVFDKYNDALCDFDSWGS